MEVLRIELTTDQITNLTVFLDRVSYKGFKEIEAIQDIMRD